jgi:hypothetical protein
VGPRKDPDLAGDLPDVLEPPAVDALPVAQDLAPDDLLLEILEGPGDQRRRLQPLLLGEGGPDRLRDLLDLPVPLLPSR